MIMKEFTNADSEFSQWASRALNNSGVLHGDKSKRRWLVIAFISSTEMGVIGYKAQRS